MKGLPLHAEELRPPRYHVTFRVAAKILLIAVALSALCGCYFGVSGWHSLGKGTEGGVGTIVWFPCKDLPKTYQCGTLTVPLDHLNVSDPRKASIGIIRYKAGGGRTPRDRVKGSIIFNPGGPGASGIAFLGSQFTSTPGQSAAERLDELFSSTLDLVSFDPRGVGESTPRISCFPDPNDELMYRASQSFYGILGSHADHLTKSELGATIANAQLIADKCHATSDMLEYVGTSFVARDMHLIHKGLGDETLTFWGMSYGSILGMAYASIYPESVGRIVLDGVVDRDDWIKGESIQQAAEIEAVFTGFFKLCFENPESCALSTLASSAEELQIKVMSFIDELKYSPIPVATASPPRLLDYSSIMKLFSFVLANPRAWPYFAVFLEELMHTSNTDKFMFLDDLHPAETDSLGRSLSIICGDSHVPRSNPGESLWSKEDLEEYLKRPMSMSPNFFAEAATDGIFCLKAWTSRAVEQFPIDMPNTSFPILALGNEFDPATPGQNAVKLASKHPNCVNVIREGYGHLSVSVRSRTLEKIISDYFVAGIVPVAGTVCKTDEDIFSSKILGIDQFSMSQALTLL